MSTTFERWRQADQAWAAQNRDLVEIAFQWFLREGEWPRVDALQRHLFQGSVQTIDVQVVADAKPHIPGQVAMMHQEKVTLGARHVLGMPAARPLLELLVAATLQAVEAYRSPMDPPSVRYDDPKFFGFDSDTVVRLPRFIEVDHPDAFAGGSYGDRWDLLVDAALVREFVGIGSPEDYVGRQLQVIERWAAAQDAVVEPPQGSLTAFVVMPFGETWSDQVFAFIRSAVDRLEGGLTAVRADQITQLGRITDQIMGALGTADIVVADITGRNPNVFWELGYAFALGKPCALLMRRGDEAPFDIYDHRRIDYESPPTVEDAERLADILRTALGLS
ncbi:MAG TPA: hypothetical protein VMB72_00375 [Acidimicrobiales bacterium]|nr:hypothetical protein [Acidimicrobiales bacterium]